MIDFENTQCNRKLMEWVYFILIGLNPMIANDTQHWPLHHLYCSLKSICHFSVSFVTQSNAGEPQHCTRQNANEFARASPRGEELG